MSDSTDIAVEPGFEAEGSKSTVSKTPPAERPRWTPTSTPSASRSIARLMTFCPAARPMRAGWSPMPVLVTLCVAQAIMGIPSDRRFLALAQRQLGHLFPHRPGQSGYHKRRRRLTETIEWLMGVFAERSPGFEDPLLLIDSTPVECARSRETVKRSALGARRWRRLRLLRQPQPLLLGIPAARHLRPRRHAQSPDAL